eukprot:178905_1
MSTPVPFKRNQIMIIGETTNVPWNDAIYLHDFITGCNSEWKEYETNTHLKGHSTAKSSDQLFLFNKNTLINYNLQTKTKSKVNLKKFRVGFGPKIFINPYNKAEIHLIGGNKSTRDYTFDDKKHVFRKYFEFSVFQHGMVGHSVLNVGKMVYIFGGKSYGPGSPLDTIYAFNGKWKKLKFTLPRGMSYTAVEKSRNGYDVFLFGGVNECGGTTDVWVLKRNKVGFYQKYKSAFSLRSCNHNVTVFNHYDPKNDEIVCSKWIKNLWCFHREFRNVQIPPTVLVKLVSIYFGNEMFYIWENGTGNNYKVNIDLILQK